MECGKSGNNCKRVVLDFIDFRIWHKYNESFSIKQGPHVESRHRVRSCIIVVKKS